MNFLPFVLSFLLIIVLGSSLLFQSFRSTSTEKTIIVSQNRAKLELISIQAAQEYDSIASKKTPEEGKKEKKEPPLQGPKPARRTPTEATYIASRSLRQNLDSSKFNLWPVIHSQVVDPLAYQSAIRLIDILYQKAEFYDPGLAKKIIDHMIEAKEDSFPKLFPKKDPDLARIYYKMLKGTNTGYPSLEEYFLLDKSDKAPVRFPYASLPVLQAVLGKRITQKILASEEDKWTNNHRTKILTKDELKKLLEHHAGEFDSNKLDTIFTFNRADKGLPQAKIDPASKVMAQHLE
jgi:hypothetical protein